MAEKVYSEVIDSFYGGIAEDVRIQNLAFSALSQNFDIWTNPKRLTPYRSVEADETQSYRITLFAYFGSQLYGRGKKTNAATSEAKVYEKTSGQPFSSSWAASATAESTNTLTGNPSLFMAYKSWLFGNTTLRLWAYAPGSATFTEDAVVGISNQSQGIVTSDDLLLVPGGQSVYKKDGEGSGPDDLWSEAIDFAQTDRVVPDLTEYGDLVAVALQPEGNFPAQFGSKVVLWDKISSDVTQTIDWGTDHLELIENLDGTLVGVSVNTRISAGAIQNKIIIREWAGGTKAKVIYELEGGAGATLRVGPNYTKIRDTNKFSFQIKITIDGVEYIQMATVGRKTANYPISFTLTQLADNGTSVTEIDGTFKLGDTVLYAHNTDGSINRTNNDGDFGDAFYITPKLTGASRVIDAARRTKQLLSAGLSLAPLPSGATASLYYRVNAASSWTLIKTYSTDDDLGSMCGQDNAGSDFINYKEVQFKATSTGGAEITGINWTWRFVGDEIGE